MLMVVVMLLALAGGAAVYKVSQHRRADATVCDALQRLDGQSYDVRAVERIHALGRAAGTHLGDITEAADGQSSPGHLRLISEDYGYIRSEV
jgi:hypothetical protein